MRTSLIQTCVKVHFGGDRMEGNAEKFPDCVITTGEALVPDKHPRDLCSAAAHIASIPTFHRCRPGFPLLSFSPSLSLFFSASHLLLCATLLLQSVLFLNQSNVVILYPAKEGGLSLRHHAKGTMSEMKKRDLQSEQRHKSKRPQSNTLPTG